jgi:hypothetical protein
MIRKLSIIKSTFLCFLLLSFFNCGAQANEFGLTHFNPYYPLLGKGPLFNFGIGNSATQNQEVTDASAHAAWSLAVPLLGEHFWGKKGKQIAGWSWIGLSLVHEIFFHATPQARNYPYYPSQVRTDTFTLVVPALLVLCF